MDSWNPDEAGAELKALFDLADEICSKPIYDETSGEDLDADTASSPQATDIQSTGVIQL